MDAVQGQPLANVRAIDVVDGHPETLPDGALWLLKGITSFERYVYHVEREELLSKQPALKRPEASYAALIPVKKSSEWWQLPHDTRRVIFETRSGHIKTGLKYMPAVARRLHHGYDSEEEFDFLTWFEFAPEHSDAFDELVWTLRQSEEWCYVEREVDIRLIR